MTIEIVNKKFYKGHCEYVGRPSPMGATHIHARLTSVARYKTSSVKESVEKNGFINGY